MTVVETAQRHRAASLDELRAAGRLVTHVEGHTICLLAEGATPLRSDTSPIESSVAT